MPLAAKAAYLPDTVRSRWLTTLRPYVRQAGNDRRPPWELAERRLLDYMLVYIHTGSGIFSLGGHETAVGPGSVFWAPPDTPHAMRGSSPEMNCLYIHFDLAYDPRRSRWDAFILGGTAEHGEWREKLHPPLEDDEIGSWRGLLPLRGHTRTLYESMRELCTEFHRNPPHYSLHATGLLWRILETIYQGLHEAAPAGSPAERLRQAAAYFREHFASRELSVEKAARRFGFSESHFRSSFRREIGSTPHEYLLDCRVERARELLCYTDWPVGVIAEQTGFASIYDFSRRFRQHFGLAPRTLRGAGTPRPPNG